MTTCSLNTGEGASYIVDITLAVCQHAFHTLDTTSICSVFIFRPHSLSRTFEGIWVYLRTCVLVCHFYMCMIVEVMVIIAITLLALRVNAQPWQRVLLREKERGCGSLDSCAVILTRPLHDSQSPKPRQRASSMETLLPWSGMYYIYIQQRNAKINHIVSQDLPKETIQDWKEALPALWLKTNKSRCACPLHAGTRGLVY